MNDPIVDEVRKVRDAHAARFHYDLDAIFRDIKEQENKSGDVRFLSSCASQNRPRRQLTGPPFRLLRRQWLPRRLRRLTVAPAYWETLSATLADRDKIIIDADKVPGGAIFGCCRSLRPVSPCWGPGARALPTNAGPTRRNVTNARLRTEVE